LIDYIEKFTVLFQLMRKLLKMLTRDDILSCRQLTHTANEVGCTVLNHLRPNEYAYHLSSPSKVQSVVGVVKARMSGLYCLQFQGFNFSITGIPLSAIEEFAKVVGPEVKEYSLRVYYCEGEPERGCLPKISPLLTASTLLSKLYLDFDLASTYINHAMRWDEVAVWGGGCQSSVHTPGGGEEWGCA